MKTISHVQMDWDSIFVLTVALVTSSHAVGSCSNNMSVWHALWQCYVSLKMRECLLKHHRGSQREIWIITQSDSYFSWKYFCHVAEFLIQRLSTNLMFNVLHGSLCKVSQWDSQNFFLKGSLFPAIPKKDLKIFVLACWISLPV